MTAYGNLAAAVAGLKYGTESKVMSRVAAEELPLGYPLFQLKGEEKSIALFNNDKATVLYSADFVALNNIHVDVVIPAPVGASTTLSVDVVFDTDQATTLAALIAAVNALAGISCVAGAARTIVVTSDNGAEIVVTTLVTLGASQATGAVTRANSGNQVFRGVSMLSQDMPVPYQAGDIVNVFYEGSIWVYCATACVAGNGVYHNSSGQFANAGTAIANAVFETNLSAAGLALITINKP